MTEECGGMGASRLGPVVRLFASFDPSRFLIAHLPEQTVYEMGRPAKRCSLGIRDDVGYAQPDDEDDARCMRGLVSVR